MRDAGTHPLHVTYSSSGSSSGARRLCEDDPSACQAASPASPPPPVAPISFPEQGVLVLDGGKYGEAADVGMCVHEEWATTAPDGETPPSPLPVSGTLPSAKSAAPPTSSKRGESVCVTVITSCVTVVGRSWRIGANTRCAQCEAELSGDLQLGSATRATLLPLL